MSLILFLAQLCHGYHQVYCSLNISFAVVQILELSVDFGWNLTGKSPECQNVFLSIF